MTALTGIKVVELSNERISLAGKLMADMGADVVLIEPIGGDPSRFYPPFVSAKAHTNNEVASSQVIQEQEAPSDANHSLYFWHYNTSKRSIELDLEQTSDQVIFRHLIAQAHVLIESEPTQRLKSLDLDYDNLKALNPRLIHAAVTPYGRNAAESDLPTTDLTLMAASGPPWSCGYDDHSLPPVRGLGNQAYHTGSHYAYMSILTALLHQNSTSSDQGQFIDVSISAALNVTTEAASYTWLVNEKTVQRQTGRHASTVATGETQMLCADGRYVNTGVPPRFPKEFGNLLQWLRTLDLEQHFPEAVFLQMGAEWQGPFDLSQIGKDDTITAIFSAGREGLKLIARSVGAQEFFIGCQDAGLAVGPINSPEEAFEDEHFKARGFQVEVEHNELDTNFRYPGAPYKLPASPWQIYARAPLLGEHQSEIYAELGLSKEAEAPR